MSNLPREFMMPEFLNLTPDEKVDRFVNVHLDTYDIPGIDRFQAEMMMLCGMHAMTIILGETFRPDREDIALKIDDFSCACLNRFTKLRLHELKRWAIDE